MAGPKVNYSRLCKHIVKIDLLTLIAYYGNIASVGEAKNVIFFMYYNVIIINGQPVLYYGYPDLSYSD